MKKSNFTEEQIIGVLKEVETGAKVAETCRQGEYCRGHLTYRTEVLDRYIFNSLTEARTMTEDWRHRYNQPCIPHAGMFRRAGAT